ncbi:hypothetical protein ASG97_10860 [Bacillus sp. Soil745]|nr:hypothetical protein ASG97_10860 [Bacillus sp. Soil745]
MKHRIQQGTSAAPRYPKPGSYLAGEISRKIGNEKAAIKYFPFVPQKNARETSLIQMARNSNGLRKQSTPMLQH